MPHDANKPGFCAICDAPAEGTYQGEPVCQPCMDDLEELDAVFLDCVEVYGDDPTKYIKRRST